MPAIFFAKLYYTFIVIRLLQFIIFTGGIIMDNAKIGSLIYRLRKEKGYTQLQLADILNISDKTISKWERGVSQS